MVCPALRDYLGPHLHVVTANGTLALPRGAPRRFRRRCGPLDRWSRRSPFACGLRLRYGLPVPGFARHDANTWQRHASTPPAPSSNACDRSPASCRPRFGVSPSERNSASRLGAAAECKAGRLCSTRRVSHVRRRPGADVVHARSSLLPHATAVLAVGEGGALFRDPCSSSNVPELRLGATRESHPASRRTAPETRRAWAYAN